MTQTVLNKNFNQHGPVSASVTASAALVALASGRRLRQLFNGKLVLAFLAVAASVTASAQTFTTKQDGAWSSASTWLGGVVPSDKIITGQTVIIKHDVMFNLNKDLDIDGGTVRIENDTLRFQSTFSKKVMLSATATLSVKNGGFIQDIPSNKSDLEMEGGRLEVISSKFYVSKSFISTDGGKHTFRNSTVKVGDKFEVSGTSGARAVDTIQSSTLEVTINGGDMIIKDYSSLRVANANILVRTGYFSNATLADITVLPGATNNFGFSGLRVTKDLENNGAWDARIDATCIMGTVKGSNVAAIDFTRPQDCSTVGGPAATELIFLNPVLKSGTANQEGAVYRFSNVATGVDAEIKMKKFSRNDILMKNFDNNTLGWNKAFQPEFGLQGVVAPFQNWYIDFEMTFLEAGTNNKKKLDRVQMTALDVDGDGWSISEYAVFNNPSITEYSAVTYLSNGGVDIADTALGLGFSNLINGPVQNFTNIDTNATQVMSTFTYLNRDKISFRYGAKSGAGSSNGSGVRLNSLWAKPFAMAPWVVLPVKFENFAVMYTNGNAELTWSVASADKLNYFAVQRSTDGKTYTNIATVLASAANRYSYKDNSVPASSGVVYYRVVGIDKVEEAQYSTVKMIKLGKEAVQTLALSTFPNPVASDVRITVPAAWQGKPVLLQLFTANGTIAQSVQLGSVNAVETMNVSALAKGMYVVKAVCGTEMAQQRIVKN